MHYLVSQDIFLLRKTLYKRARKILLYLSNLAGVVKRPNTPGCEPGIRQFESDHSPQMNKKTDSTAAGKSVFILFLPPIFFIACRKNKRIESWILFGEQKEDWIAHTNNAHKFT